MAGLNYIECSVCGVPTALDVCPKCDTVMTGENKGKPYYNLTEKERKGLKLV